MWHYERLTVGKEEVEEEEVEQGGLQCFHHSWLRGNNKVSAER